MTTYAETQGKKPFDWNEFLSMEDITQDEFKDACYLASEWVTCACGNQCHLIPREYINSNYKHNGRPIDDDLAQFGLDFYWHLKMKRFDKAKIVLELIEQRSAQLIAEIQAQQPNPAAQ
ncbi:hypothetical protein [Nonlabens agnitus]|uniref:Uncharacterized protein n=1 Tax=Nonlabens agnitus TaxID=870484 RepID=A0A2S9WXF4_9FLAO|nr:hypothetical protein [Nonlabens agnitus]PRP68131.1 hypothetical protein BST86_14050 [Nonlabens agnitus]